MSSPGVYDFRDWNNVVAAVLLSVNSCLGLLFNLTIIWSFIKYKKQRTSFNVTCVFRAINNSFVLGYAFPVVFLPSIVSGHTLFPPFAETISIVIALNCNLFHSYQGIYFALNRFFAIFFPVKYYLFFKIKWTVLIHSFIYGYQGWQIYKELILRYDNSLYVLFSVPRLAYGGLISNASEVYFWSVVVVAGPAAMNVVTFLKYYHMKKRIERQTQKVKEAKGNMVRFLQTILQDSLFLIHLFFNMVLYALKDHRLYTFFCQSFVWQSLHVLDGFIMLMFNEQLSPAKKMLFSSGTH